MWAYPVPSATQLCRQPKAELFQNKVQAPPSYSLLAVAGSLRGSTAVGAAGAVGGGASPEPHGGWAKGGSPSLQAAWGTVLWPSALTPGPQAADVLPEPGELWVNLLSWGGTVAVGARGRGASHHSGVALFLALAAKDEVCAHHPAILAVW